MASRTSLTRLCLRRDRLSSSEESRVFFSDTGAVSPVALREKARNSPVMWVIRSHMRTTTPRLS